MLTAVAHKCAKAYDTTRVKITFPGTDCLTSVLSLSEIQDLRPSSSKDYRKTKESHVICYLSSSFTSFSSRSFSIDSMNELVALSFCFLLIKKICNHVVKLISP